MQLVFRHLTSYAMTIHITMHSTLLSMVHRGDRGYDKLKTEFVAGPFSDTGDIMILHLGFA